MKTEQLFNAIRSGEADQVKMILNENPALIQEKDPRGSTPLLLATYYGFIDIAEELMQWDGAINAKDASGNTALMGVCFKGYPEIAKLLIEKGADVNIQNFNGPPL